MDGAKREERRERRERRKEKGELGTGTGPLWGGEEGGKNKAERIDINIYMTYLRGCSDISDVLRRYRRLVLGVAWTTTQHQHLHEVRSLCIMCLYVCMCMMM